MTPIGNKNRKTISALLSPSWLSGMIAVLAGLFLTIGVIAVFSANTSSVQRQLSSWQQNQPDKPLHTGALTVEEKPSLKNSWPLLLVWTIIGLVVYAIAGSIVHSISEAEEIHESLGYVNARPDAIIKLTVEHIVLRVLAAIVFGVLVSLFFKSVIPYSITAAHASASDLLSGTGVLYAFLAFAMVAVSLHLQTIFLRMSFGRPRLFSAVY